MNWYCPWGTRTLSQRWAAQWTMSSTFYSFSHGHLSWDMFDGGYGLVWKDLIITSHDNVFCVCLSVCLCVRAITFEAVDIETSLLVWWDILTIARSSLRIKIIGSRSRSYLEKYLFGYLDISLTWFYMSKVKNINEVKVISRSNCKCLYFYWLTGGGPSTDRHSSLLLHL